MAERIFKRKIYDKILDWKRANIQFWGGHSFVCGPQGEFLSEGDEADRLLLVDIDLTRSEQVRRWWSFLRDRRIECFCPLAARYLD